MATETQRRTVLAVSLNPAVDVTYEVSRLRVGEVHRVGQVRELPGGKAVNVARVLAMLGETVTVAGPAGGRNGQWLGGALERLGIEHRLVPIAAQTRRTVAVVDQDGAATGLWEPGPTVSAAEWSALRREIAGLAGGHDVVVLAGSLPPGAPPDAYAQLTADAHRAGRPVIVDADDAALLAALAAEPEIVKPNREELARVTRIGDDGWPAVIEAAQVLRRAGAGATVASCGAEGMVAVTGDGVFIAQPPEAVRGNPTGAGDAAVAALARGLARGLGWERSLREAVALAAASVLAPTAGAFSSDHYRRWRSEVVVQELAQ